MPDPVHEPRLTRHQELSDAEVASASIEELRAAYLGLREHHIAETAVLLSRRDDLTRRRDEQLAKSSETLAASQTLIERADAIMRIDEETIERLGEENRRLSEIIDFMQNRYDHVPAPQNDGWQSCDHAHRAPPCEDPRCYCEELAFKADEIAPDPARSLRPARNRGLRRRRHQGSIAESFQDMLRIAYQAGAASTSTGEAFEIWYQREVLQ